MCNSSAIASLNRIDRPRGHLMLGRAVEIGGFAFAGNQGIAKVEVSVNGGLTWNVAKLEPPLSPDVFTFLYHIRFAKCILEKYGMAASI